MRVLAIDTATSRVSVALGDGGAIAGEVSLAGGSRHAEQLVPAVRYLCTELDVPLAQLAAIAVDTGPGLFTGLRVGVTTAKVMAQSLRVPVVGIASLDLVAYPLRHSNRLIVSLLDARRRELFYATYRAVPGGVQRVSEYDVRPYAEVVADLEATPEELLLAGDGVTAYRDELATLERAELAGPGFASPSAAALVELATARIEREDFRAPSELRPLYLRTSDAQINWERARVRG